MTPDPQALLQEMESIPQDVTLQNATIKAQEARLP